jgi:hypothetical protein
MNAPAAEYCLSVRTPATAGIRRANETQVSLVAGLVLETPNWFLSLHTFNL